MFKIIAVTNRRLCAGNFLEQIERIAATGVSAVMLREKDLPAPEYEALARQVMAACRRHNTACIAHQFIGAAQRAGFDTIHLPLSVLEENPDAAKSFACLGVSVHSLEQACRAVGLGAGYVIAGHVFPTDSKKGLAPRGLHFLQELCGQVPVPVYAIGGISEQNITAVRQAGAAGACLMSSLMQNTDISSYIARLQEALNR